MKRIRENEGMKRIRESEGMKRIIIKTFRRSPSKVGQGVRSRGDLKKSGISLLCISNTSRSMNSTISNSNNTINNSNSTTSSSASQWLGMFRLLSKRFITSKTQFNPQWKSLCILTRRTVHLHKKELALWYNIRQLRNNNSLSDKSVKPRRLNSRRRTAKPRGSRTIPCTKRLFRKIKKEKSQATWKM